MSDTIHNPSLHESQQPDSLNNQNEEVFSVESYFKLVSQPQGPENQHIAKGLSRYFLMSNEQFMGDFETPEYRLHRGFIPTKTQVRLFYTRLINKTNSIATICIIHGFGEHTGRYIDVIARG